MSAAESLSLPPLGLAASSKGWAGRGNVFALRSGRAVESAAKRIESNNKSSIT